MPKVPEELNKGREKRILAHAQPEIPGMLPAFIPFGFSPAGHAVPSDCIRWYKNGQYVTADKYDLFLDDNQALLFRRYFMFGYGFPEFTSTLLPVFFSEVYGSYPGSP
jgi:hypothetical protein